ncbi:MAG: sulfur carrier protein ThiS [Thermodesulfobacteriota bacterium]
MEIQVNGEAVQIAAGESVGSYLRACGMEANRVVVEYNGAVLPRESWETAQLAAHDRLEIVQFVGGG